MDIVVWLRSLGLGKYALIDRLTVLDRRLLDVASRSVFFKRQFDKYSALPAIALV
jgi:hypothetical protein